MQSRDLILGPPGTGKTNTLLRILRALIEHGALPERIGFVSFTKASVAEAIERIGAELGVDPTAFVWARTLHSACLKLAGGRKVLDHHGIGEFASKYGYDLSSDPDEDKTRDDQIKGAYEWARSRRVGIEQAVNDPQWDSVSLAEVKLFKKRYEEFKRDLGVIDFGDMLERVLVSGARPSLDVLIVDEAQDLSPIQAMIIDQWAEPCIQVYVAGDDDQAIYSFGGGDSRWVLGLAQRYETRVLEQSYRIPHAVHRLAQRITDRIRERVPKQYRPRDHEGLVEQIHPDEIASYVQDGAMVLGRTRRLLWDVAGQLRDAGVPFFTPGLNMSPLDGQGAVAVQILIELMAGRSARPRDFDHVLKFVPSRGSRLLPHGYKAEIKRRNTTITLADLPPAFREALVQQGPVWPLGGKLRPKVRDGLQELWSRHGCLPEPKVELSTIHRAKGRQHETVVVLSDWGKAPYRTLVSGGAPADGEHRCAYVAVTRARERLLLAGSRGYAWPSSAPGEELRSA
jgi:superfamily I DNA/RNA helicase